MKIKMSTDMMRIINPGLYGTILGSFYEDTSEEHEQDFKNTMYEKAAEYINEILEEIEGVIGKCVAVEFELDSPEFYNYRNDRLDFMLEIPDDILNKIYLHYNHNEKIKHDFLEFAMKNYCSRDGFISLCPYTKERFEKILLQQNIDINVSRGIAMYIMYLVNINNFIDLDEIQEHFEDDVIEMGSYNGWYYDEEDEIE